MHGSRVCEHAPPLLRQVGAASQQNRPVERGELFVPLKPRAGAARKLGAHTLPVRARTPRRGFGDAPCVDSAPHPERASVVPLRLVGAPRDRAVDAPYFAGVWRRRAGLRRNRHRERHGAYVRCEEDAPSAVLLTARLRDVAVHLQFHGAVWTVNPGVFVQRSHELCLGAQCEHYASREDGGPPQMPHAISPCRRQCHACHGGEPWPCMGDVRNGEACGLARD